MLFLFSFFPSATVFPSSEATTLKGNLSDPGPSLLLLVVVLHLCVIHELRFFFLVNKGPCS